MHRLKGNKEAQAKYLASWSKKAYSYTDEVEQDFDELNIDKEDSLCAEGFSDVIDGQRILKFCQNHSCSGYCLKYSKSKKRKRTEKRVCRAAAAEEEETAGVSDTPGFVLRSEPVIVSAPVDTIELSYQEIINVLCSHHFRVGEATAISRLCGMSVILFLLTHLRLQGSQTMLLPMLVAKGNSTLTKEKRQMKQLVLR
jgi:hypothetical protein